ncbi:transposable element gene [Prunus dulcis]|uniref:Transposable element protein n=1 Tax=Prunus dulcis TaxID=3755 RepID=A0A4Y1QP15_PRUDU|nr:transposable element gene [Prunus dulcis]
MPGPKRPRKELNLTQVWHLNLWVMSLCPPTNPIFKAKSQTCLFQENEKESLSFLNSSTLMYVGHCPLHQGVAFLTSLCSQMITLDRGGEYLSTEFLEYLKKHGILSQWTLTGTPQLNGVSKGRNRTLMDML